MRERERERERERQTEEERERETDRGRKRKRERKKKRRCVKDQTERIREEEQTEKQTLKKREECTLGLLVQLKIGSSKMKKKVEKRVWVQIEKNVKKKFSNTEKMGTTLKWGPN